MNCQDAVMVGIGRCQDTTKWLKRLLAISRFPILALSISDFTGLPANSQLLCFSGVWYGTFPCTHLEVFIGIPYLTTELLRPEPIPPLYRCWEGKRIFGEELHVPLGASSIICLKNTTHFYASIRMCYCYLRKGRHETNWTPPSAPKSQWTSIYHLYTSPTTTSEREKLLHSNMLPDVRIRLK